MSAISRRCQRELDLVDTLGQLGLDNKALED